MSNQEANQPLLAPYGTWTSPITSAALTQDAVRLADTAIDGEWLYWLEQRPSEKGRGVVCRIGAIGAMEALTADGQSVNSRVHEYGGGAFAVADGVVYFVDAKSQQLYRQPEGGAAQALTAADGRRHGDLFVDRTRNRLICVAEQHEAHHEARNFLLAIDLEAPHRESVLAEGHDFYAAPRVSPDGSLLTFCTWNHPDMPWESSQVILAVLNAMGAIASQQHIAGGPSESAIEPRFSPAGGLWFLSDRSGFWNLYRWHGERVVAVLDDAAEYGRPPWVLGGAQFAVLETGQAVAIRDVDGISSLVMIDAITGASTTLPVPYSDLSQLRVSQHTATFVAASPLDAPALVRLDMVTGHLSVLHHSTALRLDPDTVSEPEAISYPTTGGATAHALFYAPSNAGFMGAPGELPPLIVISHGGPTTAARSFLNPLIQYWTSRGFALVDVNYRGSSGFGRAYRQALAGQWGVADVDDCVNAATYLADQSRVDRSRMAIRGGSAGGYTTLCALAFRDVFGAGASYYGIGDLAALARDTHKFESRYLERLVGPYPEAAALYAQRSPLLHVQRFSSPLLLLQGLDDKVVPPSQSSAVYEALRTRGVPVAYLPFEGEQHGFRRAATIERAIEAELYFYGKVFGFLPADHLEPIKIDNGDTLGLAAMDA
jgi:dipeptidyl aminopeptidase/acylaminoacyl peptidase